jgi:hypothetical protein
MGRWSSDERWGLARFPSRDQHAVASAMARTAQLHLRLPLGAASLEESKPDLGGTIVGLGVSTRFGVGVGIGATETALLP